MAVVNVNSDLFPASGAVNTAVDPQRARGGLRSAHFTIANAATDSSGSAYKLCTIPADAILAKSGEMRTDTWGFATVNLGTLASAPTALATAARGAATTLLAPQTAALDCVGQAAWQQLGLAAAPANNQIEIYAFASAAATGAGSMNGHIDYYWQR